MLTTDYLSALNQMKNIPVFSSTTSFEGSILEFYKDFAQFGIDGFMESLQDMSVYNNLFYLNLISFFITMTVKVHPWKARYRFGFWRILRSLQRSCADWHHERKSFIWSKVQNLSIYLRRHVLQMRFLNIFEVYDSSVGIRIGLPIRDWSRIFEPPR